MLYDILKGKHSSSFLLIQDSLSDGGICLLRAFIQEFVNRAEHTVQVMCYEKPPSYLRSRLNLVNCSPSIHFHDFCTDHRLWSSGKEEDRCLDLLSLRNALVDDELAKSVLIVDSLSTLISNIGVGKCIQQIHHIIQGWPIHKLICLVHEDLIPNPSKNLPKLCHLATTHLQVLPSIGSSEHSAVITTHIKQGGKLTRCLEQFEVDSENNLSCKELSENKKDTSFLVGEPLTKELTTFKIDLETNEQQARNNTVLPYLRREGKVYYEPDQADDWDEEDPDDDLDI